MDALEFPIRVSEMAEDQAYHIQQIVDEAQTAETRREREAKDCPENRMSFLVSRHNREREFEVLKIKRMREEHAMLLGAALRPCCSQLRRAMKQRCAPAQPITPNIAAHGRPPQQTQTRTSETR